MLVFQYDYIHKIYNSITSVTQVEVMYVYYLRDRIIYFINVNGAIWRHFGKQINNEKKLKIHNITSKAALKFGSEAWILKKREEQGLEAAQMKFL